MIYWVGSSPIWQAKSAKEIPSSGYAIPLTEDAVLETAFDEKYRHLRRLSKQAAINCSSRLAQRVALSRAGLNPAWDVYKWRPHGVLKAPASKASDGVVFIEHNRSTERLLKYVPELASIGVWEERIGGVAYEVDGFVSWPKVICFQPLRQEWDPEGEQIVRYEPTIPPDGYQAVVETVLRAVGLDHSCFCVELRWLGDPEHDWHCAWKVIEVNARLGEDDGFPELLSQGTIKPLDYIEQQVQLLDKGE